MTTLETIETRINNLGTYKQGKIEAYQTLKKDLYNKVHNNQMYQSEADLRLSNFVAEADSYSEAEYQGITDQLDTFKQIELQKIKSEYENVTADNVAELNLLATMKVSEKEMMDYLEKYKRNPLAIKKLHNIADANNIELPSYISKEDRLQEVLRILSQYAKNYRQTPIIDSYGSSSDLAFMLVLSGDEMKNAVNRYKNHFDTALGFETL